MLTAILAAFWVLAGVDSSHQISDAFYYAGLYEFSNPVYFLICERLGYQGNDLICWSALALYWFFCIFCVVQKRRWIVFSASAAVIFLFLATKEYTTWWNTTSGGTIMGWPAGWIHLSMQGGDINHATTTRIAELHPSGMALCVVTSLALAGLITLVQRPLRGAASFCLKMAWATWRGASRASWIVASGLAVLHFVASIIMCGLSISVGLGGGSDAMRTLVSIFGFILLPFGWALPFGMWDRHPLFQLIPLFFNSLTWIPFYVLFVSACRWLIRKAKPNKVLNQTVDAAGSEGMEEMKTGKVIGLTLLAVVIVVLLLPLAGSALYWAHGSLETSPTPEQCEKARMAGVILTAGFGLLEALLITAFVKIIKKERVYHGGH